MPFIIILLSLLSFSAFSATNPYPLYEKIIKANKIKNPPKLYIVFDRTENAALYRRCILNTCIGRPWIEIHTGLLQKNGKDAVAGVLAHELAHYTTSYNEYIADIKAVEYLHKAKFDACKAREMYKRWYIEKGGQGNEDGIHPTYKWRYATYSKYCKK